MVSWGWEDYGRSGSVQFGEDAVEGGTGAAGGCEGEPWGGATARFG